MTDAALDEVERELDRVVDRLNSMPLVKAESATDDTIRAAQVLLDRTRLLAGDASSGAALPRLGPQGLGAMIAVLGRDYLDAARASSPPAEPAGVVSDPADPDSVLDALVRLRRLLP